MGINNVYQICNKLDYLYACDKNWWAVHYNDVPAGVIKMSLQKTDYKDVMRFENDGDAGVSHQLPGIKTGKNGGYQAINVGYLLGYNPIVLLGFDMQVIDGKTHWHGDHPAGLNNPNDGRFDVWQKHYKVLADELKAVGVRAINCTRQTALTCFEQMPLEDVLDDVR